MKTLESILDQTEKNVDVSIQNSLLMDKINDAKWIKSSSPELKDTTVTFNGCPTIHTPLPENASKHISSVVFNQGFYVDIKALADKTFFKKVEFSDEIQGEVEEISGIEFVSESDGNFYVEPHSKSPYAFTRFKNCKFNCPNVPVFLSKNYNVNSTSINLSGFKGVVKQITVQSSTSTDEDYKWIRSILKYVATYQQGEGQLIPNKSFTPERTWGLQCKTDNIFIEADFEFIILTKNKSSVSTNQETEYLGKFGNWHIFVSLGLANTPV